MNHPIGTALFLLAVLTNLLLITAGLVFGLAISTYRAVRAFQEQAAIALRLQSAYHRPDAVRTPAFEKVFMAAAIALVMAGLPAALAAIFHFVLPLLGTSWVR